MPRIQLSVTKGVFSPEQKTQMISRLSDAKVSIEGKNYPSEKAAVCVSRERAMKVSPLHTIR